MGCAIWKTCAPWGWAAWGALRRRGGPLHKEVDLNGVTLHYELEEALSQGYDLVVVANPTSLHMPVALAAAGAGCHPLHRQARQSQPGRSGPTFRAWCKKKGLKTQVGCQLRFHPCLAQARAWLKEERIGRPVQAICQVGEWLPGWHPWEDYRQSYAARAELGGAGWCSPFIHEIDYLHWLLGPLTPLAARGRRLRSPGTGCGGPRLPSCFQSRSGAAVSLSIGLSATTPRAQPQNRGR